MNASSIQYRLPALLLMAATICVQNLSAAADPADVLDVDASKPSRMILHVCASDGTPIRPLIADKVLRHTYDRQGTPDVSADGKQIVFDAWAGRPGFTWQDSRIIITNFDGDDARNISDGVMPCFSPQGDRLAVSRPAKYAVADGAKGLSIWVMKTDGSEKKMIADQGAWGARWSPDGKSLVFHGGVDDEGANVPQNCLRLYDFETQKTKLVFTPDESPFAELGYHFDWAKHPKRMVAFGGQLKAGGVPASAIIDVDAGRKSLEIVVGIDREPQIAHGLSFEWHPTLEQILVTAISDGRPVPHLLPLDVRAKTTKFDGLPKNVGARDPVYMPDGKHLIASLHAARSR